MRTRIEKLSPLLVMASTQACGDSDEAQEELAEVSLDQALSLPADQLAEDYLVVKYRILLAKLAQCGATVKRSLDESADLINSGNAAAYLNSLEKRLCVYEKAIRQRGFTYLAQAYMATADAACEKIGVGSVPTLCEQTEFHVRIAQGLLIHHGVVVESSVVFEHSENPEIRLSGKVRSDQIFFNTRNNGLSALMHPCTCRVVLKKVDQKDKSFALAYLGRAMGYLRMSETKKSLADFAEAIRIDPNLAPAYALRSQLFSTSNDASVRNGERAIRDATRACKLTNWEDWQYLRPLSAAYAEKGDFRNAIKWVNEAIKSAPASELTELREELEQYRQHKPSRFETYFTDDNPLSSSFDSPVDAVGWFDRGKAKFDVGEYDGSISDFTEAIRLDSTIPSAYFYRAEAYRKANEAERAISDYTNALRLDATYAPAFMGRAKARSMSGDRKGASTDFGEAIRLQPQNADAHSCRAYELLSIGDDQQALVDLNQAILIDPRSSWSYSTRGYLWQTSREYAKAIQDYESALELEPENAWVLNQLAWLLATCPDPRCLNGRRAIELATKVGAFSERNYHYVDTLAAAHAAVGDFEQAIRWQKKSMELAPVASQKGFRERLELYKSGKPYKES